MLLELLEHLDLLGSLLVMILEPLLLLEHLDLPSILKNLEHLVLQDCSLYYHPNSLFLLRH
jgi:hypothetical protein